MAPKKKNPLESEATNESVPVVYQGVDLEIPTGDAIPRVALKAFEQGHLVGFVESMLGDQLRLVEKHLETVGDVKELGKLISDAMGSNVGE
jgi:hypothetical protein